MKNIIDNIISENIRKYLIKESISRVVYHFTDIFSLIEILKDDRFCLSTTFGGDMEKKSPKRFFLSVTRQRSAESGYAYLMDLNVRITLDGDKLNQRYKGKPVDFFSDLGIGKESYYKSSPIPSVQTSTESEDRIYSDTPTIENIWKYIKRIDILYNNSDTEVKPAIISNILRKYDIGNKIFVYDNRKDFNFQTSKYVNANYLNDTTDLQLFGKSMLYPSSDIPEGLINILCFMVRKEGIRDKGSAGEYIKNILNQYDMGNYVTGVLNQLVKIDLNRPPEYFKAGNHMGNLSRFGNKSVYIKVGKMLNDFCRKKGLKYA